MFEDDPDVIENGADRQMAHVRRFQIGKQSALSQRLLNELSASRVCLLNAANKAEYDEHLQSVLDSDADDSEPAMAVEGIADWAADEPLHHRMLHPKKRRKRFPVVLSLFGVVLLLMGFAGYVTNWGRTESPPEKSPEKSPTSRTVRQRQLPPLPQPGDPPSQDTTPQDTTPDE